MVSAEREKLRGITTFDSLVEYLRDSLDWPIQEANYEALTFPYEPEELGIDPINAAKIESIKQLRPLVANQPWGIFFVEFEPKRLPIVALRRILNSLALKKRASNVVDRAAWQIDDLLFISNYGEGNERQINLAHFTHANSRTDTPRLRVLGWDNQDTPLHLGHVITELTGKLAWPKDQTNAEEWRKTWRSAFTIEYREAITTSRDLAIHLAELARAFRDRINTILAIETESGPVTQLMKAFQVALIHDLDKAGFADMYAQTIAYGLLSAKVANHSGGDVSTQSTALPVANPFLRELMDTFLEVDGKRTNPDNAASLDFDELGVRELVDLLDAANMDAIVQDFGDRNPREDPVIHFYELFLKEYDAKQRMQRGVFFTPRPVVSSIVRSVDEFLRSEFGLADGLADTATWEEMTEQYPDLEIPEGATPDQTFVQILDPATGTGTFLVEAIDVVYKTMTSKWQGEGHSSESIELLWNNYVPNNLLPRLHGYELLMAPYAIAHMKIGLKLKETGYQLRIDDRVRIYLTNALEANRHFQISFDVPALAREAESVNEIKRNQRFTVIIGNPPYANFGQLNNGEWISKHLEEYKRGLHEKKTNLDDDYIKFIRLAQITVERSGHGVVGMITANSYLDGVTHRQMRKSLIDSYSSLLFLNLHGNIRRKEIGPENRKEENVFDIMQGVSISVFVIGSPIKSTRRIQQADLWGSREDKIERLINDRVDWKDLIPEAELFLFIPQDNVVTAEYDTFISLLELFQSVGQGIQTKRDTVAIQFNESDLNNVLTDLQSMTASSFSARYGVPPVSASWSIESARKDVAENAGQAIEILVRPFDSRRTYFTGKTNGFLARPRTKSTRNMLSANVALVAKRQTKEQQFSSAWVVDKPINEGFFSIDPRGRETLFPLEYSVDSQQGYLTDGSQSGNLSNLITDKVPVHLKPFDDKKVFEYIYGILHSSEYRTRYADCLKSEFPRIPFPKQKHTFSDIGQIGNELILLHTGRVAGSDLGSKFPISGEGNAVVQSKVEFRDRKIILSDSSELTNVESEIWEFRIGGYRICERWLKDRRGRTLADSELASLRTMIFAIRRTLDLTRKIDQCISDTGGWSDSFL